MGLTGFALVKQGTGTMVLAGANNYTGGTTITSGTLQIGTGGSAGSITGGVTDNATLAFNRSDNVTYGSAIGGTGNLAKYGVGTLTLSTANTFGGVTLVNSGTLLLANALALGQSTFDCGSSGTAGLSFGTLGGGHAGRPARDQQPQPAQRLLGGGGPERGQQRHEHQL